MEDTKYGKYIVTELKAPRLPPGMADDYAKWAKRVLWMDNNVVEGAFNSICSWYLRPPEKQLGQHSHDYGEMIGFFGSDPQDPYVLGGEIEFWLEDEKHILTRSCLIYVPAGLKHCPMIIRRVDRPILHIGSSVK
jgi:hypothetical protein